MIIINPSFNGLLLHLFYKSGLALFPDSSSIILHVDVSPI